MLDSCQCMAKPIQYCKVKIIKINKNFKKRRETDKSVAKLDVRWWWPRTSEQGGSSGYNEILSDSG